MLRSVQPRGAGRDPAGRAPRTWGARNGFVTGYRGLRIAKSGRRFWIDDGIAWELIDSGGGYHGQAATFSSWRDA
jgi:MEKHLA domain-containing protein